MSWNYLLPAACFPLGLLVAAFAAAIPLFDIFFFFLSLWGWDERVEEPVAFLLIGRPFARSNDPARRESRRVEEAWFALPRCFCCCFPITYKVERTIVYY